MRWRAESTPSPRRCAARRSGFANPSAPATSPAVTALARGVPATRRRFRPRGRRSVLPGKVGRNAIGLAATAPSEDGRDRRAGRRGRRSVPPAFRAPTARPSPAVSPSGTEASASSRPRSSGNGWRSRWLVRGRSSAPSTRWARSRRSGRRVDGWRTAGWTWWPA